MDDATLKALKGSIAKWEGIVAGTCIDFGCANCPLCQLFHRNRMAGNCLGCPVYEKTGKRNCGDTPYQEYFDEERGEDGGVAAAQREVDFLKSLLPAEEAA